MMIIHKDTRATEPGAHTSLEPDWQQNARPSLKFFYFSEVTREDITDFFFFREIDHKDRGACNNLYLKW